MHKIYPTHKGFAPIPLNKGGDRVSEGGGCISPNKGSTSTVCRRRGVPSSQKGVGVILWVIIAAAVLLGGGYLFVQKSKSKVENMGTVAEQAAAPTAQKDAQSQSPVPADWETYRDETHGFEFKYPKWWKTESSGGTLYFFDKAKESEEYYLGQYAVAVSLGANPKKLPVRQWFDENVFKTERQIVGEVVLDGVPALETSESGMVEDRVLYISKGGTVLRFSVSKSSGYTDVFEQILSSLKFTPPPTSATNDWKTYRNEQYGFEFRYPQDTFVLKSTTQLLPPAPYHDSYMGVKLISAERVDTLGKKQCYYGESGLQVICTVEKERGINFVEVDKAVRDLTASLTSPLTTIVTIAGKPSIKWSIGAEGDGIDYYFIPADSSRTLVISRQYVDEGLPSGFPSKELFDQILSTFRFTK